METKAKKKVLISFVGSRDPYSEGKIKRLLKKVKGQETSSEGAILTACRWLEPDIVYLLPSSKEGAAKTSRPENHTEDKAVETKEILESKFGVKECTVMPLMTDNATDTTKLYTCLRNNMRKIFNNLAKNKNNYFDEHSIKQNYDLIFILTSGTQQMNEAARLYLPSLPYEFSYYMCSDPKYAQGKDRVKPTSLQLAEETLLLKSIEDNVKGYYFHSVIENCEKLSEISILKPRQGRASIIKDIFTGYSQMDVMQYKEAYDLILKASNYCNDKKEDFLKTQQTLPIERICNVLDKQVKYLEKLKAKVEANDEREDEYNLVDLCYNMERAYTHGNYADVLARFWRLREGMMNYRMLIFLHLDRRNLRKEFPNPKEEKARKRSYDLLSGSNSSDKVDWNNGWVKNDLGAIVSILIRCFHDSDLDKFEKNYQKVLEELRDKRNQTIVAHGMLPVSEIEAKKCISLEKEIINLIPGGWKVYNNYPFKGKDMLEILNLLKHV